MFPLLIFPSFDHFKIELILIFSTGFKFQFVKHIFLLMIIFSSLFVVLLFLEESFVLTGGGLYTLTVFAVRSAVFVGGGGHILGGWFYNQLVIF
jgi:hypothetical protein